MTAEIINLRQVRKTRARTRDQQLASDNRAKYGLTKEQREKARLAREKAAKRLDQLKRGEAIDETTDDIDPGNVS